MELVDGTNLLGYLNPVYSSAKPQIMGSCAVSSLPEIYHFLKYVVPGMSPDTTTAVSDWSALAAQERQPRDEGATLVDILVATVVPGADEEVLDENEEMT